MAPKGTVTLRDALTGRYTLWVWLGVALIAVPTVYWVWAASNPGAALILASLAGLLAFVAGTLLAWPMERKITWQRQLEVFAYRLGTALGTYVVVGFAALFLANTFTDRLVPLDWPTGFIRRLPFWPFYVLAMLSCQGFLPSPPGAC